MARRKPLAQGMNLGSRIMMDAASVQHALDISKSTLGRLIRRESDHFNAFPVAV